MVYRFYLQEGNFNITLRELNGSNYTSVMLTFQRDLHIDDLPLLVFIKDKLNCYIYLNLGQIVNLF